MAVYFVFSDDAGGYSATPNRSFRERTPYFIRSGVIVRGDDWPLLRSEINQLRSKHTLPDTELKWSYIWSLEVHRRRNEDIPADRSYSAFKDHSTDELLAYVNDCLKLLSECDNCRIVCTVTFNGNSTFLKESIYQMHIQDLMQRTEMEIQGGGGLAALFLDSEDRNSEAIIRQAYATIYKQGDFIEHYSHIMDSLAFVLSHHSCGIKVADYVAGVFNNFLRGFQDSTEMFKNLIWPLLPKDYNGDPLGFGICEIPTDKSGVRQKIRDRFVDAGLLGSRDIEELPF